ncbi:MAG: PEP-CTERM sorting domain-containing protein [Sphingomonadales bacterium]|nr:MAG: PEP-CTERM sorting domain-containing protein [Sphingomonadales bacterium]
MKALFLALAIVLPAPACAQAPASAEKTILFVGNSFTQGAHSAVKRYRADAVTDLNGDGFGGVPALFKTFTEQAGLHWKVSLETQGGKTLGFHYGERRAKLSGKWDIVVLQELSTLDRDKPGDATGYLKYAPMLAALAVQANPKAAVLLMSTWSRADQVYQPGSPWSGKPIAAMAEDLRTAADRVRAASKDIRGVLPVGQAWNRAIAKGVADANPYDGIAFGQVDLWAYDHYHASIYGYYLEALIVFGQITGIDPLTLGKEERAASDLGISKDQAVALQRIASEQLAEERAR